MQVLISNYSLSTIPTTYSTAINQEYASVVSERLTESVTVANVEITSLNNRIFSLLAEYGQLPEGWDGDDAARPDQSALHMAWYISLILERSGQKIFHAAPGPQGEIMVDLRSVDSERSIEILLYPKERFVYVTFSQNDRSHQGQFNISLLPTLLEWLNGPVNE
jgi:hypothetical protein